MPVPRKIRPFRSAFQLLILRLGLENRCGRKITEGSNPSLSACQDRAENREPEDHFLSIAFDAGEVHILPAA
jgi:hypothetical protein